jgi:hypothetical protein
MIQCNEIIGNIIGAITELDRIHHTFRETIMILLHVTISTTRRRLIGYGIIDYLLIFVEGVIGALIGGV